MPANNTLDKTFVAKVIEAARLAVALTGAIHQRKIPWLAGLQKAPLYCRGEGFGVPNTDESTHADGVPILDEQAAWSIERNFPPIHPPWSSPRTRAQCPTEDSELISRPIRGGVGNYASA